MKIASRILSLLVLVSLMTFYIACDKKDDPKKSTEQEQIDKLVGTWTASEVTFDQGAPPTDHSSLQLTITKASDNSLHYEVANRPSGQPTPWPANGEFTFGSNATTSLVRSGDNVAITYSVSENTLTMDFNFPESSTPYTGRTKSVGGDWHFEFTK